VTFGSFNNLAKITPEAIVLWSRIIRDLPGSRLFIKNPALTDRNVRERFQARFADAGLAAGQVELVGHTPTRREHLELYGRVDIALDTFPYNGTTTTCEALWMGVPVLALAGERHAGRVGSSLLGSVGLEDWIARDREDYVSRAVRHAGNRQELTGLRAGMRRRLSASPLCDAVRFAKNVEQAYRVMWRKWCAEGRRG
jgi:predicted O-linked N-acetylglucosamine transferase (SPINDLY family)